MSPKRALLVALACSVALACNKAPAKDALAAAEQAFAAAPEIEAYLPEESRALKQVLRDARVSFDEGHYTEALRAVQPCRIGSPRPPGGGGASGTRPPGTTMTRVAGASALVARLTTPRRRTEAQASGPGHWAFHAHLGLDRGKRGPERGELATAGFRSGTRGRSRRIVSRCCRPACRCRPPRPLAPPLAAPTPARHHVGGRLGAPAIIDAPRGPESP